MRLRIAALVLAAGALGVPAAAKEKPPRLPGTVTLSDGTTLEGLLRTTAGKPLRIYEEGTGRVLEVPLGRVHRLVTRIVSEEEYRVWRWVEDGSREKVYTGETFPRREYAVEVTLRTGQVLRGHCVAVLYLYPEGKVKPVKVYLKKKEQGRKGKTLADLVYVESIEMRGKIAGGDAWASGIRLSVSPPGVVLAAHALPRESDRAATGTLDRAGGVVSFPALLPGTYDLAVVTRQRIYLHLAVGKGGGTPLEGEALAPIRSRVAEVADFFERREVLAAVREKDRVRALVLKERSGPTSMGGALEFRRFEIWSLHRGGDRWLVDHRAYLWREHGEDLPPPQGFALTDALGNVKVESGRAEVAFAVPQGEER